MLYNVYYSKQVTGLGNFLIGLSKENLELFIKCYEDGINEYLYKGKTYNVSNLKVVNIFDCSKYQYDKENAIEHLENHMRLNEFWGTGETLKKYGNDLTEQFVKRLWGFKKKEKVAKDSTNVNKQYVNKDRIEELKTVTSTKFDLTKLIRICEELNSAFQNKNDYTVGILIRAIIDHIPPVFGFTDFDGVANNYKAEGNSKSFKASMKHLNQSLKNIADSFLHSQIRKKEVLPNETQVDCKMDLDVLLGEVIRILKH